MADTTNGSKPKVMSGARGYLSIIDRGKAKKVGIFTTVSWGLAYDTQPAYILGRYSPAEIDYTAQTPVSVSAGGWRVIGHSPHAVSGLPYLKELLTHEYCVLTLTDRQTGAVIANIRNVRPTGYSTTLSARNLEEITAQFIGIYCDDESGDNSERADSMEIDTMS